MKNNLWYKVAGKLIRAGGLPFPITDTIMSICKILISEEVAENLVLNFRKRSMTLEQLKEKSKFDEYYLREMLESLIDSGVGAVYPSDSSGIDVYYLAGPVPGIFERIFMKGETGEKFTKLAILFEKYFKEIGDAFQKDYDNVMGLFYTIPPIYRIVPVEEKIDVHKELVLPYEEVSKIIEKFDIIAVGICYCRHQRELLEDPCKLNAPKNNCLFFGKTAKFFLERGITQKISKEDALKIVKEAEDIGLVHRAFHSSQDINKDEFALCNCCKCCCEVFHSFYIGSIAMNNLTSYKATIQHELCVDCETCIEKCPMEAIEFIDDYIEIKEERCIGCGLCSHHCPQDAISLIRTGPRQVIVPIAKIT